MASPLPTTFTAICILFASTAPARAQASADWLAIHDGPAGQADNALKCAVDASGNVFVGGRSNSTSTSTSSDFETVKYSPAGVELWSRRLDGLGGQDWVTDIGVDAAGDVYVTGYAQVGLSPRLALIKYQSDGTFAWSHFVGPSFGKGQELAFDAANNVLVVGYGLGSSTGFDLWVLSYSPQGQLLWSTQVDGGTSGVDVGYAIAVAPGGDIYATGEMADAAGIGDLGLVKLNASGALQWKLGVDGGTGERDVAYAIAIAHDERIAIAGWSYHASTVQDFAMVEFDSVGNASPLRTYDGPANGLDQAYSIAIDASGVSWTLGLSVGSGTGYDFAVVRHDAAGQLLSAKRYNGPANKNDYPREIVLGSAGGAWACGYVLGLAADSNVVLVQYDADGNQILANAFSTPGLFEDRIFDADLAPSGRIALAGWTTGGPSGGEDYLALQLDMNALPQGYCTAKVNSLGCSPILEFTGLSKASAASGFVVRASNVRNYKPGMLLYSVSGAASLPFQGGTLCVQGPIKRTLGVNSLGAFPPANDCSGVFALDLNAFASGALGGMPLPGLLVAGTQVFCQWWGRDPGFAAPNNTALSSGMSYRVLP